MPRAKVKPKIPDHPNTVTKPFINIDWDKVDGYIKFQCTGEEIAGILGIHPNTLYQRTLQEKGMRYCDYASSKKTSGLGVLRARQFQAALAGNTRMLDKLGDEYLGQGRKSSDTTPNDAKLDALFTSIGDKKEGIENDTESKTDQSNQRSEPEIQHLGGGGSVGENVL